MSFELIPAGAVIILAILFVAGLALTSDVKNAKRDLNASKGEYVGYMKRFSWIISLGISISVGMYIIMITRDFEIILSLISVTVVCPVVFWVLKSSFIPLLSYQYKVTLRLRLFWVNFTFPRLRA